MITKIIVNAFGNNYLVTSHGINLLASKPNLEMRKRTLKGYNKIDLATPPDFCLVTDNTPEAERESWELLFNTFKDSQTPNGESVNTDNYDAKINFTHRLGNSLAKGCIHIVSETVIVHINDFEESYIFIPLYDPDRVVTIKHVCAASSEMTILEEKNMITNLETWLSQFSESPHTEITQLLADHYTWFNDLFGKSI